MDTNSRPDKEEEEEQNPHSKFKEIISSLPKRNCWGGATYCKYQGFWSRIEVLPAIMLAQQNFNPQPCDIFLSSFPKSGTTWLKALAFTIVTRSQFIDDPNNPLLTTPIHRCVPFIEAVNNNNGHCHQRIRLFGTHIPYPFLPVSILASGCKIVYICRDPKDVLISTWFYMKKFSYVDPQSYPSMEEALELFCEGVQTSGPFWEHVLGYWKASLDCPERILFLKYEDLKEDIVTVVKRLAEFIGYPFTIEEERHGLVQKVIALCSFENLSNLDVNVWETSKFIFSNSWFFRKGEVGDWKNHLTQEMAHCLDQITEQKLSGSDLTFTSHKSLR